jgi:hypothetical protein
LLFNLYLELFFPKLNNEDKNKIFKLVYDDEEKLKELIKYAKNDPKGVAKMISPILNSN